jgi:hypothetical protein
VLGFLNSFLVTDCRDIPGFSSNMGQFSELCEACILPVAITETNRIQLVLSGMQTNKTYAINTVLFPLVVCLPQRDLSNSGRNGSYRD